MNEYILLYGYITFYLSIPSSDETFLDYFHSLAIKDNAAINICVKVFMWVYVFIFLVYVYLGIKLTGHMVILRSPF